MGLTRRRMSAARLALASSAVGTLVAADRSALFMVVALRAR